MEMNFTTLSSKGQVVIPQEIRKKMKLKKGTVFFINAKKNIVALKKVGIDLTEEEKEDLEDVAKAWKDIEKGKYEEYTLPEFLKELDKIEAKLAK